MKKSLDIGKSIKPLKLHKPMFSPQLILGPIFINSVNPTTDM